MQLKRQLIAVFLLAVLSIALVPKGWLHELHAHEDTEHIEAQDGTTAFENHHHHCIIFTTESPVFTSETPQFVAVYQVLDFIHGTYLTCSDNHRHVIPANLRGPPATCIS
jgi:hypothetical protein